jgi:hypothetical protein
MFVCRNVSLYLLPGIQHHKNSNPFFFANFPDDMFILQKCEPMFLDNFQTEPYLQKNQYEHRERERERERARGETGGRQRERERARGETGGRERERARGETGGRERERERKNTPAAVAASPAPYS